MTHLRIRFTKRICDGTGHMHQTTQAVVEVWHARSVDRALKAAQHRFARMHRAKTWGTHADGFEVDAFEPTLARALFAQLHTQ
jgi:hypothetical protein